MTHHAHCMVGYVGANGRLGILETPAKIFLVNFLLQPFFHHVLGTGSLCSAWGGVQ